MNPKLPAIAASQLLISIRGAKKTGKSSLQKRMCGKAVPETYTPTSITQTRTTHWTPRGKVGSTVTLTLLDVVSSNARVTATAHGMPHGVIVLYDPRDQESVNYAHQVIEETPRSIPIALLTNFQDVITADLHPLFRNYSERCYCISSSMVTNLGLAELAHWLELPLALNVYNAYHTLHTSCDREITRLKAMFTPGTHQVRVGMNPDAEDDLGFWSDDDTNLDSQVRKTLRRDKKRKKKELPDLDNIQLYAPPPTAARTEKGEDEDVDELMKAIIQTASTSKKVVGLDEIDFDNDQAAQAAARARVTPLPQSQVRIPTLSAAPPPQAPAPRESKEKRHKHHHRKSSSRRRDEPLQIQAAPLRPPAPVFRQPQQMINAPLKANAQSLYQRPVPAMQTAAPPPPRGDYDTI